MDGCARPEIQKQGLIKNTMVLSLMLLQNPYRVPNAEYNKESDKETFPSLDPEVYCNIKQFLAIRHAQDMEDLHRGRVKPGNKKQRVLRQ